MWLYEIWKSNENKLRNANVVWVITQLLSYVMFAAGKFTACAASVGVTVTSIKTFKQKPIFECRWDKRNEPHVTTCKSCRRD